MTDDSSYLEPKIKLPSFFFFSFFMHQPPTHFLFALKTPREENPFDARRRIERDHPFKKTAGQRNNVVQKLFGTWKFVKKKGGGEERGENKRKTYKEKEKK